MYWITGLFLLLAGAVQALRPGPSHGRPFPGQYEWPEQSLPPPPSPEPIDIIELPLPPVTSSTEDGSCSLAINPHGTGCIGTTTGLQAGNFYPDGNHIVAIVAFAGAPAAPDPASIYAGNQIIIIKADGTVFPNGDSWKCITCGIPVSQSGGVNPSSVDYSYPQAFLDRKQILAGAHIVSCGSNDLVSDACRPNSTWIYPIRLDNKADGSGPGAYIRELRLHPDNIHVGVNSFGVSAAGTISEVAYYGRLEFDSAPTTGDSHVPRYNVAKPNLLLDASGSSPVYTEGDEIFINSSSITVGELRGFSGTGREITYIGYSVESCNIDVFAVDLFTGKVRRLTSHPGYCDPVEMSPDDEWIVILDTRGSGRTEFMDGLRWLPPLTDLVSSLACASVRNNRDRRFFQPWLLDRWGDRGDYYGQSINQAEKGKYGTGAVDDPQWNARADPWFSPDGTKIVYWQAQAVSPACGGANPLPCYNSTEPGGRDSRVMLAKLTNRHPLPPRVMAAPYPDIIPWAVQYNAGDVVPDRPHPPEGKYTLKGSISGFANVGIIENVAKTGVQTVTVELANYSDHVGGLISGYQNISASTKAITTTHLDWYTNLSRTGEEAATQWSSTDGFHMSIDVLTNIFDSNGTLETIAEGTTYRQPLNGA